MKHSWRTAVVFFRLARLARRRPSRHWLRCLLFLVLSLNGCQTIDWPDTPLPTPKREPLVASIRYRSHVDPLECSRGMNLAESEYALAIDLEEACRSECVDHYYKAIAAVWPFVATSACQDSHCHNQRACEIYRACCSKLLTTAQQFGRLRLPHGLWVSTGLGRRWIPIQLHGFIWPADAFNRLIPVGDYEVEEANCVYRSEGLGVPLIVQRERCYNELLYRRTQAFAATAVVRPEANRDVVTRSLVIELYDPSRVEQVQIDGAYHRLYRDLTAAFEHAAQTRTQDGIEGFLQPGATENNAGLFMLEPYQAGKVPVIFVHGLLSAPTTWIAMANELQSRPELKDRIQLWGFEYPTGQAFVGSAADLREQLWRFREQLDPERGDPALDQMVLIGHSMGGLISKLQVTDSQDILWKSVSDRPLPEIKTTPSTHQRLARSFFFTPSPDVRRVIYIGTPHCGSAFASRAVGRLGSLLVEEPDARKEAHQQLMDDNPCVFSEEMERRVPTSIDLLRPDSELLQAMDRLPRSRGVAFHSIIGTGRTMLLEGPADGVVPVSSAEQAGVSSELKVDEIHTELHRSNTVIAEVMRILQQHIATFDREGRDSRAAVVE